MKKLLMLVAAGCMVLGSLGTASAVDVKVKGQWWFHYGYYSNNLSSKSDTGTHNDRLRARQRVRTQIQFVADENLSAMLNLEANQHWGDAKGGGLDADKASFVIKHAYLDWTLPNTNVKTRMGMQGMRLPSVTFGNNVLNADVAGITVSSQLTPELGLTVFWARPYDAYNDTDTQYDGKNSWDDMDMLGVMLPIKTDVVRATPWGMIALIGKDSAYFGANGAGAVQGASGVYGGRGRSVSNIAGAGEVDSQVWGWWAGTTFELPVLDPFFVKLDAMMGGLETGQSEYDSFGWMIATDIGYKFSFGSLSAFGWYASGDDEDDDRGIMPIVSDDSGFGPTAYGTAGGRVRNYDRQIGNGLGMWGVGLKMADLSFVDNLKHTISAAYMGGTNKGDSVNRRSVRDAVGMDRFGNQFLMTSDRAWEVNLLNTYKVNDNLSLNLDLAYLWLDLGDHWADKKDTEGSFATMVGVTYSF